MMIDELVANTTVVVKYNFRAIVVDVIFQQIWYTVQSFALEITNELAVESCLAAVFTSSSTLSSQV